MASYLLSTPVYELAKKRELVFVSPGVARAPAKRRDATRTKRMSSGCLRFTLENLGNHLNS